MANEILNNTHIFNVNDSILDKDKNFSLEESDSVLKFYTIEDLYAKKYPPQEWFIDEIIPKNAITLLSAAPASFKTWLALEMANKITSGEKFLNTFETEQTGVLLIDAESGERQLKNYLSILGVKPTAKIYYGCFNGRKLNKNFVCDVMRTCKKNGIGLVIFDSLVRFHDGNENDARDISNFFQYISYLKSVDIATIIIHHNRKEPTMIGSYGRSQKDSIRGSSDILASCDLHLSITRQKDNSIIISQTKNRFSTELPPLKSAICKK